MVDLTKGASKDQIIEMYRSILFWTPLTKEEAWIEVDAMLKYENITLDFSLDALKEKFK